MPRTQIKGNGFRAGRTGKHVSTTLLISGYLAMTTCLLTSQVDKHRRAESTGMNSIAVPVHQLKQQTDHGILDVIQKVHCDFLFVEY